MDRTGDWYAIDPLRVIATPDRPFLSAQDFLFYLAESKLFSPAEVEAFLTEHPTLRQGDAFRLIDVLVSQGRLNDFQVSRLVAGQTFGLVLGHYRIVGQLGSGGMGVVYKAEHIHMKRVVAIKVLVSEDDHDSIFLQRFYSEMQALAVLRHPNIVLAFDAGEVDMPHTPTKVLRYLVMEYVTGRNLEQYVQDEGPLPIVQACQYVRQAAEGLRHAHEHGLVHRDIKPSNVLVTPQDQVKILDFGLARLCRRRCTEAHAMLGTVDYMAPEQARDARAVDIRADIYGLGGVLYWLLSGQKPFAKDRSPLEELLARQHEGPLPLRRLRPEVPGELDAIIGQMMAPDPADRFPTPLTVITALNSFLDRLNAPSPLSSAATEHGLYGGETLLELDLSVAEPRLEVGRPTHRLLVVSARDEFRTACAQVLTSVGFECLQAQNAGEVFDWLVRGLCDLLVIDGDLPDGEGLQLCRQLRSEPPAPHIKLLLIAPSQLAEDACSDVGADDFLVPTATPSEVQARVHLALRLKDSEERCDRMAHHLLATNAQLEQAMRQRDDELYQAQDVLIFAMAKMAELRGLETGAHLLRMQGYVRVLGEEAMRLPAFAGCLDETHIRMLERCVLLHDIGKVAMPDHVLLKPGLLEPEERSIMESHTVVGANILEAVARQHGACLAFLDMAIDITRHHHERYDGAGYPDGLRGEAIPLAARIVTVADVYDALRCKLVYKPGLPHAAARRLILDVNKGQFDPALLVAFRQCEASFEQVFEQTVD